MTISEELLKEWESMAYDEEPAWEFDPNPQRILDLIKEYRRLRFALKETDRCLCEAHTALTEIRYLLDKQNEISEIENAK